MERLVVEKLWSLSPKKFKTISLKKAIKLYGDYIISYAIYHKEFRQELSLSGIKSFVVWLKTEI